ncbi:dihydrofolate reductase family protein [Microcella alkalica]|uniref:Dihydrofolate reductase n=1 Tax=Microcella alkalica TaxID=355930 RepID=A0A839E793_9MICO|nr:dihydrofolate reductase family protein [Microcella alkalica]MBA8847013.1 dihydrofolate reductase [Microcella alkalica]
MSTVQYYVAQSLDGFFADVGAVVMGAGTLRFLLEEGGQWAYPGLPVWVLTHGEVPQIEGADLRVVSRDASRAVREARPAAGERSVWLVGGGSTAAQLAAIGEIDELGMTAMPLTLGAETRLLPTTGEPLVREMTGTTAFENGAVELRYRRRSEG